MRRRHVGLAIAAVMVAGAGGAWAATASTSDSLDAEERAVVEEVESGPHRDAAGAAARFVNENITLLLSPDVADDVDGAELAALFEVALDGDTTDGVFETVVSAVAEEGKIHSPDLRPVLGDAAAARLAWFDAEINTFTSDNSDQWSELRARYDAAFVFLRETMRDSVAGDRLRQAVAEFGQAEVLAAPETGEARSYRLTDIGRLQAFFALANYEAEKGEARADRNLDGMQDARDADMARRREDRNAWVTWVAFDRFDSDPEVRAAAADEPFTDDTGALKPRMTDTETEAFEAWATNEARDRGLLLHDVIPFDAGNTQVRAGG